MIDGFERADGELQLALQLADFRLAPFAECRDPLARLAACHEIRVLGEVALAGMQLRSLAAAARARTPENAETAGWRSLEAAVAPLAGGSALRGMAQRVFAATAALPADDERALLTEALLNFAPGLIQCMAALSHRLALFLRPGAVRSAGSEPGASALLNSGGFPDSCYMWRTSGAASRSRLG